MANLFADLICQVLGTCTYEISGLVALRPCTLYVSNYAHKVANSKEKIFEGNVSFYVS